MIGGMYSRPLQWCEMIYDLGAYTANVRQYLVLLEQLHAVALIHHMVERCRTPQ